MPLGKGLVMTEAEKLRIHKLSQEGLGYKKIAAAQIGRASCRERVFPLV